jgi:acetate kinase
MSLSYRHDIVAARSLRRAMPRLTRGAVSRPGVDFGRELRQAADSPSDLGSKPVLAKELDFVARAGAASAPGDCCAGIANEPGRYIRARLDSRAPRPGRESDNRQGGGGAHLDPMILTLNAGSSSIKFAAFRFESNADLKPLASGQIEGLGAAAAKGQIETADGEATPIELAPSGGGRIDHDAAMAAILDWLRQAGHDRSVAAVGHRIVHGGTDLVEPTLIDDPAMAKIRRLIPLAPLHQPHNIAGVEASMKAFPSTPQVACFDTAFHRSHPFVSDVFALPRSYYDEGVRRYGFHGISYEYVTRKLKTVAPSIALKNVIIAHLGNGASMCAVKEGRSIASTMAFTALDGLSMGTRCGQIDPGVLLYLMTEKRMNADQISDLLYKESGLKGMSGLSQDMRELEASDSPAARDAIAYFVARARRELGGLAATLDGADAIVFTAGIGEHAWRVRESILSGMEWMGVDLDREANRAGAEIITSPSSRTTVFVLPTNEERMIAEHTVATARVAKSGGAVAPA